MGGTDTDTVRTVKGSGLIDKLTPGSTPAGLRTQIVECLHSVAARNAPVMAIVSTPPPSLHDLLFFSLSSTARRQTAAADPLRTRSDTCVVYANGLELWPLAGSCRQESST